MLINLNQIVNKLESGSRPKGGVKNDCCEIPSLGAEHLNSAGGFNFKNIRFVPLTFFQNQKNGIIDREDILIVKDGATTGKVSFVDNDFPHKKASINEHLFKISINKSLALSKYVFWYLFSDFGKKLILKDFRGATVGGISRGFVNKVKIPLPSVEDQKRIVKILDVVDALRQKRKQAITLLDDYLKSVFLEMFGDPVTNTKKIKTYRGSDLFKFSSGKFNPTKNLSDGFKYPTYGGNGITGYSKDYLIDYDTLVIGRVGAYCGCVHKTSGKIWITDNAIFVKDFKQEVNLEFMNFQFKFLKFNKFADFSGQPKITQKPLDKIEYLVPPLEVQKRFDEIVKKTESLKQKMLIQSQELETEFQALMQKAFKGEL